MTKLFALESIQEIPYTEPASMTEAASDLIDSELGAEEVIRYQAEMGDAICIAETLDAIGEHVEKAPDGLSAPIGRALTTALECLCAIDFGDDSKIAMPAFEEFSTYRAQKQTSMESLDKIKAFGRRVWDWIVKLLRDIVKSIKKLFNIQDAKQKAQGAEIDSVVAEVKKTKAENHAPTEVKKPTPNYFNSGTTLAVGYTPPGFKDKVTMHRLSTNGRFVGGEDTIGSFKRHNELMYSLENGFLAIERDIITNLESALRNIFVPGKDIFSVFINKSMVAITAHLTGHQIPNRRELPTGVSTFERPLVFGGMSIYREGISTSEPVDLGSETLRTSFDLTSHSHEAKLPTVAPYLTIDELEDGMTLVKARWTASSTYISRLEDVSDSLSDLEKHVGKIAMENTDDTKVQRRAHRILQVIHAYLDTRRVFANSLVSYSHAVNAAMMNYCVKSNRGE